MAANHRGGKGKKVMTPSLPGEAAGVLSEAVKPGGNRNDRRFIVNQPAYVSCAGADEIFTARICDISRRGMQLILDRAAALDPAVLIEWNGREIRATVRYQQLRGVDYRVGVELNGSWDSLVSDVLAQQAEELRQSNLALQRAEHELVEAADVLRHKNQELAAALDLASQASEIKSRFLASVSHEFRTPLNGIIGFSELLYDAVVGPVTDDQQSCLSDILSCSRHLLTLINQVLDLTKIESGKMDFQHEEVLLENVAREVMDGVKGIAAGKRISLRLEGEGRVGAVRADAARLRQVLFNYLSNALKCTADAGWVVVRIAPESATSYRLEVEDNGVGIHPEDIPRLFREFGQLGASEKAKDGTGLGLAITRRIVEAQGGRVGVESTPGVGSRFWAVLPSDPAGDSARVF
jgi:signal transduction histidine kinase